MPWACPGLKWARKEHLKLGSGQTRRLGTSILREERASVESFSHESVTGGNVSDYCCAVSMERGGKTGQDPPETWKFIAVLGGVECSFARRLRSDARQTETSLPRLNCKQLCSENNCKVRRRRYFKVAPVLLDKLRSLHVRTSHHAHLTVS